MASPIRYTLADRHFAVTAYNAGLHIEKEIAPALGRTLESTQQFLAALRRQGLIGYRRTFKGEPQ